MGAPSAATEPSLTDVARAAATGDAAATARILRAIGPWLVRIVRAVLGAAHPDVDDASQLALIGFVQALPAYRGDCEPAAYARIIAVRAAIATRKRARTQSARRDDEAEAEGIAGPASSPGDRASARQRKEILRDLLAELPAEQAEALAMRIVLGCSLEEVAARTGVPANTVRSRVRLAKERLRSRIEGDASLLEALEVRS